MNFFLFFFFYQILTQYTNKEYTKKKKNIVYSLILSHINCFSCTVLFILFEDLRGNIVIDIVGHI